MRKRRLGALQGVGTQAQLLDQPWVGARTLTLVCRKDLGSLVGAPEAVLGLPSAIERLAKLLA